MRFLHLEIFTFVNNKSVLVIFIFISQLICSLTAKVKSKKYAYVEVELN